MKNTYFFALGRGPYMGPEYVGTKILADFGSAIMWSSILHLGSKHMAALKQTHNKI